MKTAILLGATALAVVGVAILATLLTLALTDDDVTDDDARGRTVQAISADYPKEFLEHWPIFFRLDNFYLSVEDDEYVALYAFDPDANSRRQGGIVEWLPDFEFRGRTGWFRDPCFGGTYDLSGKLVSGPSPRDMDRFAVEIRDGYVYVDTRHVLCAPSEECELAPRQN